MLSDELLQYQSNPFSHLDFNIDESEQPMKKSGSNLSHFSNTVNEYTTSMKQVCNIHIYCISFWTSI